MKTPKDLLWNFLIKEGIIIFLGYIRDYTEFNMWD